MSSEVEGKMKKNPRTYFLLCSSREPSDAGFGAVRVRLALAVRSAVRADNDCQILAVPRFLDWCPNCNYQWWC